MLKEIDEHAKKGENFAFETTLAGLRHLGHLKRIEKWRTVRLCSQIAFFVTRNTRTSS